jgi:hypothetical protein
MVLAGARRAPRRRMSLLTISLSLILVALVLLLETMRRVIRAR